MAKLFYITAGIFTLNVIFSFIIGEVQVAVQLGFATLVLWMWAYLIESNWDKINNGKQFKEDIKE